MNIYSLKLWIVIVIALFSTPSYAHLADAHIGFMSGFTHPILGVDHLLAMLAVGIISVQLGDKYMFKVPTIFVVMMVVGAISGLNNFAVPYVEQGISLSVLLLGVAITFANPGKYSIFIIAFVVYFGFLHGYAHGAETPDMHGPVYYGGGFLVSTAFIHLLGAGLAVLLTKLKSAYSPFKLVGLAISLAGIFLLAQVVA